MLVLVKSRRWLCLNCSDFSVGHSRLYPRTVFSLLNKKHDYALISSKLLFISPKNSFGSAIAWGRPLQLLGHFWATRPLSFVSVGLSAIKRDVSSSNSVPSRSPQLPNRWFSSSRNFHHHCSKAPFCETVFCYALQHQINLKFQFYLLGCLFVCFVAVSHVLARLSCGFREMIIKKS